MCLWIWGTFWSFIDKDNMAMMSVNFESAHGLTIVVRSSEGQGSSSCSQGEAVGLSWL